MRNHPFRREYVARQQAGRKGPVTAPRLIEPESTAGIHHGPRQSKPGLLILGKVYTCFRGNHERLPGVTGSTSRVMHDIDPDLMYLVTITETKRPSDSSKVAKF